MVRKLVPRVVAAFVLVLFAAGGAQAAAIAFRPALIPQMGPPAPVPLAIDPAGPTTTSVISFTAPLDGAVYSNSCYAARALLGSPVLAIDEANRAIHIYFDGVYSDICTENYDPVLGAYGEFGPLAAGNWTFYNSHGESLAFTVVPEPASLLLLSAAAAGLVARRRRKR